MARYPSSRFDEIWRASARARARSPIAFQDERGQGQQTAGGRPQRGELLAGLAAQAFGPSPALVDAEQAGVGQLAAGGVLPHALAGLVGGAFHVQQIVGDLKGQPETPAVAVETFQRLRPAARSGA